MKVRYDGESAEIKKPITDLSEQWWAGQDTGLHCRNRPGERRGDPPRRPIPPPQRSQRFGRQVFHLFGRVRASGALGGGGAGALLALSVELERMRGGVRGGVRGGRPPLRVRGAGFRPRPLRFRGQLGGVGVAALAGLRDDGGRLRRVLEGAEGAALLQRPPPSELPSLGPTATGLGTQGQEHSAG